MGMSIVSTRQLDLCQRQLDSLVKFARQLGLSVRIGNKTAFSPRQPHSIVWLAGCGNYVRHLGKDRRSLYRFIQSLTKDLAHELAHYFVASKRERRRKNYGIPSASKRPSQDNMRWELNEAKVFYMETAIRKHFKLPYKKDPLYRPIRFFDSRVFKKEVKEWWKSAGAEILNENLQ